MGGGWLKLMETEVGPLPAIWSKEIQSWTSHVLIGLLLYQRDPPLQTSSAQHLIKRKRLSEKCGHRPPRWQFLLPQERDPRLRFCLLQCFKISRKKNVAKVDQAAHARHKDRVIHLLSTKTHHLLI